MIGIKGMELPKSCSSCEITEYYCHICPIIGESKLDYKDNRNPNCPLVDLGKEDMSWEELVEKVKELKSDLLTINEDYIRYRSFAECWDCLEFGIDNQIVFKYMDEQKVIHTDKSFFQMYQIIKSLVGDER